MRPIVGARALIGCTLLTDASIVAFAGSCPLLKSVNLGCCKLITDASIGALKSALPDVSVYDKYGN